MIEVFLRGESVVRHLASENQRSPDELSEHKRENKIRSSAQEVRPLTNESRRKRPQRRREVGAERDPE